MGFVTLAWVFGSVWSTAISGAPLTIFAKSLDASKFSSGCSRRCRSSPRWRRCPPSWLTERTGARKRLFLLGNYTQRALWFPITLIPYWIVVRHGSGATRVAMAAFLVLVFLMHVAGNVGGARVDELDGGPRARAAARQILFATPAVGHPHRHPRGRVRGVVSRSPRQQRRAARAHRGAALVRDPVLLLGRLRADDIALFQPVPEIRKDPQPSVPLFGVLKAPLRDKEFLWFGGFIATLTFAISFMGQFVTLYCIERVGVTEPGHADDAARRADGRAADRPARVGTRRRPHGQEADPDPGRAGPRARRPGLVPDDQRHGVARLPALGAGGGVLDGRRSREPQPGARIQRRLGETTPTSAAAAATSPSTASSSTSPGCLGGLTAGVLAQWLSTWQYETGSTLIPQLTFYEILFAISAFLRLAAVVIFLPHIHEHGASGTREALRFMSANIYNNLFNAVLQPLRYLRVRSVYRDETL
jgi:hypothetical protein